MTVIDVFLDRPSVVPEEKISVFGDRLMPEILVSDVLEGGSRQVHSMDAAKPPPDPALIIKEKEDNSSSLLYKKQKILVKSNRTPVRSRRKSRWKLKFHHQALPPEYLRHYKQQERKRRQTETTKNTHVKSKNRKVVKKSESSEKPGVKMEEIPDRLTETAGPAGPPSPGTPSDSNNLLPALPHLNIDVSQNKAFLENLLTNQIEINRVEQKTRKATDVKTSLSQFNKLKNVRQEDARQKSFSIPPSGKIMNYSDLPYMGEITLDGIKPRRGRKPKKADICHLIYKNYGQVFPGAPSGQPEEEQSKKQKWRPEASRSQLNSSQGTKGRAGSSQDPRLESPLPTVSGLINHTEVQNRIINSLLEKRLTQGVREELKTWQENEEPLNLCVRDLQSLKIKLSRKHGNIYETKQKDADVEVKIKTEVIEGSESEAETTDENEEEDDLAPFNLVTTELRESSDDDTFLNFNDQITLTRVNPPGKTDKPEVDNQLLFWPRNFLPLCYPKLKEEKNKPQKSKPKRSPPSKPAHVITKRKRSAIFIPPVPAESTTNPTTEVSICKFKFTGGAKPSLQEKKMLSVDSGGNFRYYSGTGDKSMRGYEYFPRESLQQCQENTGCSPSGVFLTASALGSGEKIPEEIGHSGFFDSDFPLQIPKPKKSKKLEKRLPEVGCYLAPKQEADVGYDDVDNMSDQSGEGFDLRTIPQSYFDAFKIQEENSQMSTDKSDEGSSPRNRKLRKSRKSLAREKLEQTFKEKGFLIQTQQLESAEGATYCKFRQLRKFTRYLFRSWKDYLPGNVRNLSVDAGVENPEMLLGLPEAAGLKMEALKAEGAEGLK